MLAVGGWLWWVARLGNEAERMSSCWSVGNTNDWELLELVGSVWYEDLVRVMMFFWGPELCYLFFSREMPRPRWHVQIRHRRGLQLAFVAWQCPFSDPQRHEQTAMPLVSSKNDQERAGRGGEVAACGMVWRQ